MKSTQHHRHPATLLIISIFAAALLLAPHITFAKMDIVAIEGMNYNANASLADNLSALSGKTVTITLNSGKTFTGTVKKVGTGLLYLEQLEGREYYDALIRIEDISAIDARFRTPKR